MTQTVLILGGRGKIGSHSATAFGNAGWTVRHYDRRSGDMTAAAMGADVIVNGLNPPNYHNWAQLIPQITAQVIAAATASGATVILPGNIYNFGNQPGVLDDTTPQTANTRKGRIRIAMEESYRAAGVPVINLRAGNFIDPNGNGDVMSMVYMRDIAKGRLTAPGRRDVRQAFAYLPDWARAAVMLAEQRANLPTFADIPFPGHCFTFDELKAGVARITGREMAVSTLPWWLFTLLSPFVEVLRELREMRYSYDMDHAISDKRFKALLPHFNPTPLDQVMSAGLPGDVHPDKVVRAGIQTVLSQ